MIKPGLKGEPCSEGNAQEKGHRRSPAPGVYLHFLSLCFGRRYLNSSWGDNWCHWCQLQLAHNKPTPVWGQSLAGAVPPAWATFLPQNSSCSLPTSGALMDARTIPAAGALPSFLHHWGPNSAFACPNQHQTEGTVLEQLFWLLQAGTALISQARVCENKLTLKKIEFPWKSIPSQGARPIHNN